MKILEFRPLRKNTLIGFFALELDSGLAIKDCSIHEKSGKRWFSFPARPMVDASGQIMRGDDGRIRYSPILFISDRKRSDQLQALVLAALEPHLEA